MKFIILFGFITLFSIQQSKATSAKEQAFYDEQANKETAPKSKPNLYGMNPRSKEEMVAAEQAKGNVASGWKGTGGKAMKPDFTDDNIAPKKPARQTSARPTPKQPPIVETTSQEKAIPPKQSYSPPTKPQTPEPTPTTKTKKEKGKKKKKQLSLFKKKPSKKDTMVIGNPELKKIGDITTVHKEFSTLDQNEKAEIIKINQQINKANKEVNKTEHIRRVMRLNSEEQTRNYERNEKNKAILASQPQPKSKSIFGKIFGPKQGHPVGVRAR
jgi:hypothetical protein